MRSVPPLTPEDTSSPSLARLREHGRDDRTLIARAVAVAILLHLVAFGVRLPQLRSAVLPQPAEHGVFVRRYVPPPPPIEQQRVVRQKPERRLPVPDPTPEDPEPIVEQRIELDFAVPLDDVEVLLGQPHPPGPGKEILLAGYGDVTNPERIPDSYIRPEYPEKARRARVEGQVILQAIIHRDGTVGEIEVLQARPTGVGFADTAIEAVSQWRYRPARQNGEPVDVYFTIVVDFDLA
jgi:protein TonB